MTFTLFCSFDLNATCLCSKITIKLWYIYTYIIRGFVIEILSFINTLQLKYQFFSLFLTFVFSIFCWKEYFQPFSPSDQQSSAFLKYYWRVLVLIWCFSGPVGNHLHLGCSSGSSCCGCCCSLFSVFLGCPCQGRGKPRHSTGRWRGISWQIRVG